MPLTYSDVVAMLDRAVGGAETPVSFHGAFWRNKTRDEFVATPTFKGIRPVIVGDGAASGIVLALAGAGPFNSAAGGIERMPPFGPYLADEEIAAIAQWIDAGFPDEALNPGEGGTGMPELKILVVKDQVKMGLLIEDLASGNIPTPRSIEDMNTLLLDRGIVDRPSQDDLDNDFEPHWPNGRPADIEVIRIPDNVFMLSIPSPLAIREGRELAERLGINGYPFAQGYDLNYQNPARRTSLSQAEWDTIYKTRLGDYTIGKCM